MNQKIIQKRLLISALILLVATILFTILVKCIDVVNYHPIVVETLEPYKDSIQVGFSQLNLFVNGKIGYHSLPYKLSTVLGYVAFAPVAVFGLIGLIQLIKRKSLKKVDHHILVLGVFYIVVLIVYFAFKFIHINYRPIIKDGKLEEGFPSSHTMLAVCTMTSLIVEIRFFTKNMKIKIATDVVSILFMLGILGCRFAAGVHWASDIIGGLLFSVTLLLFYLWGLLKFKPTETEK